MSESKQQLIAFIKSKQIMPLEKATAIADRFTEVMFTKNDLISKQGKTCNDYYFLCTGFMRSWTIDIEGRDVTTAFYSEGGVVCELLSFFKRTPSGENIQALTDGTALHLSFEELNNAFHEMPEFREFGRSVLIHFYATLKQRTLSSLHETAEQRYKDLITATPEIFQYASLKNIASYLGITDTSLSRIRKEFSRESIAS
jgi:CRP-like cAMP-binding protein